MNKVSIALCTYNGAIFLREQLESFVNQTKPPDELVVCDDCSSDETVLIIKEFSKSAAFPVRLYINEKNLGSTKNFEKAVSLSSGDLIFLSDQDDVWMPEKIEIMTAEFDKNSQVGMVFSDAELVDENLSSLGQNLWSFTFSEQRQRIGRENGLFDVLLTQNAVTGATMAFRREFRKNFMPIPEDIPNLIHDAWISLIISNCAESVFLAKPLIKYRQHNLQQLGVDFQDNKIKNFNERKISYSKSIAFTEKEIERLKQMKELFGAYSQFKNRHGKIDFAKIIKEKEEKIVHYRTRMNLPPMRVKRVLPVFREFSSRRYKRFSKGILSVIKDLLEKW